MKTTKLICIVFLCIYSRILTAQNGELDASFGDNGLATTNLSMTAEAMAVQPDGRIVLVGFTFDPGVSTFMVNRFLPSGQPDSTFGNNGHIYFGNGPFDYTPNCVAIQPDGKILVGGTSLLGPSGDFIVIRLLSSGTLDSTFNGTGVVKIDFANTNDKANAMLVQPDGKIILAGETQLAMLSSFGIVRINPNGALDQSFDGDGKFAYNFSGLVSKATSVSMQSDGKLLLAGQAGNKMALIRVNVNGGLDDTFGSSGQVLYAAASIQSMALQSDSKIVVAGSYSSPGKFYACRFNADGSADNSFGAYGFASWDIAGIAFAIALQPDGRILLAGNANNKFAVVKCDPNGSLNQDFGTAGIATTGMVCNNCNAVAIQYQPDQTILVGGSRSLPFYNFPVIVRFHTALDPIFILESTESQVEALPVRLYPNPACREVNVEYYLEQDADVTIQLFNALGSLQQTLLRAASQKAGWTTEQLDLDPLLPKGHYMISINHGQRCIPLEIQ